MADWQPQGCPSRRARVRGAPQAKIFFDFLIEKAIQFVLKLLFQTNPLVHVTDTITSNDKPTLVV
jgi:hypothetical protein